MRRPHHYTFAHVALRHAYLRDPKRFMLALVHEGLPFLERLWDAVGATVREEDVDAEILPVTGLQFVLHQLRGGYFAAIVTLPMPHHLTEAYFVGLVLRPEKRRWFGFGSLRELQARYITLEYGMRLGAGTDGEPRTVLCEWTESMHRNFGDGPEPTSDAFVARLRELIGAEKAWRH